MTDHTADILTMDGPRRFTPADKRHGAISELGALLFSTERTADGWVNVFDRDAAVTVCMDGTFDRLAKMGRTDRWRGECENVRGMIWDALTPAPPHPLSWAVIQGLIYLGWAAE